MKEIVIRADGGQEIGYGHFMRGMALYQVLKSQFNPTFCCLNPDSFQQKMIRDNCKEYIFLEDASNHYHDFLKIAGEFRIVVLDNYYFDTAFQKEIKNLGCKLVCIDDIHDKHFHADVVINHSPSATSSQYSVDSGTQLCLGLDYAILRKEFLQAIDIPDYSKRKGISLMIGGADPENIALRISGILLNGKPGCQINVISNDINNPDFLSLSEKFPQRIKVYKNLEAGKIASIFQTSRIGIFPASTSAFEAIACRLPFIVGYFVDNQIDNYRGFIEKKLASGIGDLNTVDAKTILETVETLETDTVLYESIMKNQAMAFDGLSSERLRKIFISL